MARKVQIRLVLGLGALLVATAFFATLKLLKSPEWHVLSGSVEERQVVCRSVYRKGALRATWCLRRLLEDPEPSVQLPAIEALARRPDLQDRFTDTVDRLVHGENQHVAARAMEYVFQRDGCLGKPDLELAREWLSNDEFRDQEPEFLRAYLAAAVAAEDQRAMAWVVGLLERHAIENTGPYQAVLTRPDLLRRFRPRLMGCLESAEPGERQFAVTALTAIDGVNRGLRASDWREPAKAQDVVASAVPLDGFTIEAEWAHRIQPNFQIDEQEGALALHLGEGAGGNHFWRRHTYDTVDIGKAHVVFVLRESGNYQIWCRCWFLDKCGNHSLLHVDDRWLKWRNAGYEDKHDVLRKWHWKALETRVPLSAGRHTLTITAGDDGLAYDKLAILPAGETFDPQRPPPMASLFDPAVPTSLSITAPMQAQNRGTTQELVVWVRRNSGEITQGTVRFAAPAPFELESASSVTIRFTGESPLAAARFRVRLKPDAAGGEVTVHATFSVDGEDTAVGTMVLGVNPDWLTTGPLTPSDPRCSELLRRFSYAKSDHDAGWEKYPPQGFDRYRRLMFEQVYGQQQKRLIFLYTEIEVGEDVELKSFMTVDDNGFVFIDGKPVSGRNEPGVGEGWMLVDTCRLGAGRHQVVAWVEQADFPEPSGPNAGRESPNHWLLKWLLRKSRFRPATQVKTVPYNDFLYPKTP